MNNKPILFMSSSFLNVESISSLKDLGYVLNLDDEKIKDIDVQSYAAKNFILCDMKNKLSVSKLRFIKNDTVLRVCILRSHESCTADWVVKLKPDYVIKTFDFVKECSTKDDILRFVQLFASIKDVDDDVKFYAKSLKSFLKGCFGSSD